MGHYENTIFFFLQQAVPALESVYVRVSMLHDCTNTRALRKSAPAGKRCAHSGANLDAVFMVELGKQRSIV